MEKRLDFYQDQGVRLHSQKSGMNSTQYEELCRFYISKMLGVESDSIRSVHVQNPIRSDLPGYEHQIDLYWETEDAVSHYLNIANAKWRGASKVDQPDVLLLQQVRQKVAAHKALMITNSGFTRGAIAVAQDDGIGLHVVIPSFNGSLLPSHGREAIQKTLSEIEAMEGRVFIADIAYKSLSSADTNESFVSSGNDETNLELWIIRELERSRDYLRDITSKGYDVNESRILRLEREIAERKRKYLAQQENNYKD